MWPVRSDIAPATEPNDLNNQDMVFFKSILIELKYDLPRNGVWARYMLLAAARIKTIQRSSVVERSAVNRLVVGSNPTAGAILCPAATCANEESAIFSFEKLCAIATALGRDVGSLTRELPVRDRD